MVGWYIPMNGEEFRYSKLSDGKALLHLFTDEAAYKSSPYAVKYPSEIIVRYEKIFDFWPNVEVAGVEFNSIGVHLFEHLIHFRCLAGSYFVNIVVCLQNVPTGDRFALCRLRGREAGALLRDL